MSSRHHGSLAGLASLACLVAALPLAGCGGKLDPGTPAAQSTALRSFVGTVTEAQIVESWSPGGSLRAISVGKTARIDVRIDDAGQVELVAIAPFGEPVRATGARGATTAVDVPRAGDYVSNGLSFSGTSGGWSVNETYAHFVIAFDEAGVPRTLTATGQASAFAGDVGTQGTATATIALSADVTPPSWRASAAASFANEALPWDARTVEASEPYEGQADFASLYPGANRADFEVTTLATTVAWGSPAATRERGVTLVAKRWDAVAGLQAWGAPVSDVAGNVASRTPLSSEGIGVKLLGGPVLPAGAAGGVPFGGAKSATDCGDGKPCLVVGPFRQSYCGGGSAGGVAARLRGAGRATFRVRLTAKALYGGVPGGQPALHLLATNPGSKPASDSQELPATMSPDGIYDTGWKTVSLATPNVAASETGVAVSAGGLGSAPVIADCGPAPSPAEVTVYIGEIAIAP